MKNKATLQFQKLFLIFSIFAITACNKEEGDRMGDLDASKPAAIGGNFLAGYQDGALYSKGQELSIPALIFQQMAIYQGLEFNVPLIAGETEGIGVNPKPWESLFQTRSILGTRVDCNNVESLGPVKQLHTATNFTDFNNVASASSGYYQCVPFMTTQDMINPAFGLSMADGNSNPFYHRWASTPGASTPVSELLAYKPTFAVVWLGMEDIYNYAINGGVGQTIPSVNDFRTNLETILSGLAENGAKGVVANIPSIDYFPFFNLIPYNGANLDAIQADDLNNLYSISGINNINFIEGANGFITYDQAAPNGIRHLVEGEKMLLTVPLDSIRCSLYGLLLQFINDRYTLTLPELSLIHQRTNAYNEVIAELADQYGFAFFDANRFFDEVNSGVKWNGADFDLRFVSGGFLSLDGLHPNQKGYQLVANGMIQTINKRYNTRIPVINCPNCDGVLFP
jgi:hypothetical protein